MCDRIRACDFDYSGEGFTDAGLTRQFTTDHTGEAFTNFRPFKIFRDGREVVRSHWRGDSQTGEFATDRGRITERLGREFIALVTAYGRRGNFAGYSYIDEMRSNALISLSHGALKFDDTRTDNAFAYLTVITHNAFLKVLKDEKRAQILRDTLLMDAGANPSIGFKDVD
ncbi:hypothetical protein QH494_02555 [Sphingomonas sp. AR_OL41]|uniref:hypothetical protein n=1 Tax=Sphingomonas sp. AR_OL41 TaxID=3042729 RepID=UPI00247FE207|nr:hypothetical protein [Sphingomonas sp. AR_OL41]MDH7971050.1 hypothetical protein [Sphingomonas sp. AR_OL41]